MLFLVLLVLLYTRTHCTTETFIRMSDSNVPVLVVIFIGFRRTRPNAAQSRRRRQRLAESNEDRRENWRIRVGHTLQVPVFVEHVLAVDSREG